MAASRLSNGFTKTPNQLLERSLQTPMTLRQLKVVIAVIRLTYGWRRKTTTVSIRRLAQMIVVHHSHASVAVRSLVERNILIRDGNAIGVQEDYERWEAPKEHRV